MMNENQLWFSLVTQCEWLLMFIGYQFWYFIMFYLSEQAADYDTKIPADLIAPSLISM